MAALERVADARRIVVKVGSSLIVEEASGAPREAWLASLVADLAGLRQGGAETIVVSSGAIALGRGVIGYGSRPLQLEESQAAAAAGQIRLAGLWARALAEAGLKAAQVLLTLRDTEERRSYLNARATVNELLRVGVVPVINENDTTATTEIRYGDNDRLAARVATMASADLLVLLSDVEGLYTAPPGEDASAELLPYVDEISPRIEAMAGGAGSGLARGGMRTKIDAAKIATRSGTTMVIASGRLDHPLAAIDSTRRATWFPATRSPAAARKVWIAGSLTAQGSLTVDDGALAALRAGRSLLPAGVTRVEGAFQRGDAVRILSSTGEEVGRGLSSYDADEARLIAGRKSQTIPSILGYRGRAAMVHRDDLVLHRPGSPPEDL